MEKNDNWIKAGVTLSLLFTLALVILLTNTSSERSYWKNRSAEIQDNYEAISKENEELRDSIYKLKTSLKVSPIHN